MGTKNVIVYFPGFNGLRFFGALLIIIHHIEQFKSIFRFKNYSGNSLIEAAGSLGVTFFFVLSGFLITYLMLAEKANRGSIAIKRFYLRRMLRIWPLYYLIAVLSFFVFPRISFLYVPRHTSELSQSFNLKATLFFAILPNICLILFPFIPFCSQSWAIGAEEQFYLFWPWVMNRIKSYLWSFCCMFVIFFLTVKALNFLTVHNRHLISNRLIFNIVDFVRLFLTWNRWDCFIIGALAAAVLYYNNKALKHIFSPYSQVCVLFLMLLGIWRGVLLKGVYHEVFSLLFCVLILNVGANPKSLIRLENRLLNFLGKISYGLYMYHILAIVGMLYLTGRLFSGNLNGMWPNIFLYVSSIITTLFLAVVSYYFYENRFLRLKDCFLGNRG